MSDASTSSQILSWLLFGTKVVGGLIITLTFVLYCNQEKLLYIPNPPGFPKTPDENPPGFNSPKDWSKSGKALSRADTSKDSIPFEEKFVTTSDGKAIHTWLMLQSDSVNVPTLIYFHGNAGNMGFRLKNAAMMFATAKINILMMDYRGYGSSDGTPTEAGLNADGEAVLNYAVAHPKLRNSPIILFGRSLGGAVAVSLAHKLPGRVAGLVLENTFLSVGDMVDVLMPFLTPLKDLMLFMKWDSGVKIKDLKHPILFISGDSDELVPPSHMKVLFEAAKQSVHRDFFSVLGGSHNNTFEVAGAAYYSRLADFVRDHILNQQPPALAATATAASAPKGRSEGASGAGCSSEPKVAEEDDYCLVDRNGSPEPSASLPTMGTNFRVK